ncbi:MAG: hypothetical protein GC159_06220 [Phycisphaera sp.]|nr:hypothetical protein [Phycisphaera sp.]
MTTTRRTVTMSTLLAALLAMFVSADARADLHVLTIGGGYSPTGNQVSLEKNVQYFRRVLEDKHLADVPQHLLFADGDDPARDVVFTDPEHPAPRVVELMADLFGSTNHLSDSYRSHELSGVDGPSSVETIDKWFNDVGSKLTPNDRLLIYFTGHGGKTVKKDTENTKMYLWNNTHLTVSDFVARLDKLDPKVPVTMVMVQCFSGGFANVIFKEGDPKKGLDDHKRCGFFATVATRTAAGCTPDINEANYHEYSSYFWAALAGFDRLGHRLEMTPDFNHDGRICYDEAHGYALLTSSTIDISVKTSDAFLRTFSKLKQPKKAEDAIEGLMTLDVPFERVLEAAGPTDRAVLEGLSATLELKGPDRVADAGDKADDIEEQRRTLSKDYGKLKRERDGLGQRIVAELKKRWPEMNNMWHPEVARLIREQPDEVLKVIESTGQLKRFDELGEKMESIETQRLDLEKQWVKTQRFLRVTENVVLAANLPRVATQEIQDRYAALLAAEADSLR